MQQAYDAPSGDRHETRARARLPPSDTLTLADRLAEEGGSDEEIERLAGLTVCEILALRADRATRRQKRGV